MIRISKDTGVQKYDINHINDISVINVGGELSRYNIRSLEEVFSSLLERGQLSVILNFGNLNHIDYQLVRRLADHIVYFQCEGGDIKIAGASSYVQQILQVMGFEEEIFVSVEDALMSFFVHHPDGDLQ